MKTKAHHELSSSIRRVMLAACATLVSVALTASAARADNVLSVPCSDGAPGIVDAVSAADAVPNTTIELAPGCVYTFQGAASDWYGPSALPPISSAITIEGNGALLHRYGDPMRLAFIGPDPNDPATAGFTTPGPGALTLVDTIVTGFGVVGGDGAYGGGGGAGLGGAIFNLGQLNLQRDTFQQDSAQGGNAATPWSDGANGGGGGLGTGGVGGVWGAGDCRDPSSTCGADSVHYNGYAGDGGGFSIDFNSNANPQPPHIGATGGAGATASAYPCRAGGGAGFAGENGNGVGPAGQSGAGGGTRDGLGGYSGSAAGGDGSGGGGGGPAANVDHFGCGSDGGDFGVGGEGGFNAPYDTYTGGGGGGGVGGGGGDMLYATSSGGSGGGGGFGGGGGAGPVGGAGGFGGGGGASSTGPGDPSQPKFAAGGFGGGSGGAPGNPYGGGGAGMGGAIFNFLGDVVVTNSTFTHDSAMPGTGANPGAGVGGAIANLNGTVTVQGSTFYLNRADAGGGAIADFGVDAATARSAGVTIRDSILYGTASPGVDLAVNAPSRIQGLTNKATASVDVSQNNIVGTSFAPASGTEGSITGTALSSDPQLGRFAFHGGLTPNYTIPDSSPASRTGGDCALSDDQRGIPRGRPCDIGAVDVHHPVNDAFANASPVLGDSGAVTGSNVDAVPEPGEPWPFHISTHGTVWWYWTAPTSGGYEFNTCGSTVTALVAVYDGAALDSLHLDGSGDGAVADCGNGVQSSVARLRATAGTTYHILVDSQAAADGEHDQGGLVLNHFPLKPVPPSLFSNPVSPSDATNVQLFGSRFDETSTVRLYRARDCSGPVIDVLPGSSLAATGVTITVPEGSTTDFSATATDPYGDVSDCSHPLRYVQVPPGTITVDRAAAFIGPGSPVVTTGVAAGCTAGGPACTLTATAVTQAQGLPARDSAAGSGRRRAAKLITIGTVRLRISAGRSRAVSFKLNAAGRRLLARRGTVRMTMRITIAKRGFPPVHRTVVETLRRTRRRNA